jgi:hypothetical protein
MIVYSSIILIVCLLKKCQTAHFRGGTISWAPVNPYATGSPIQIQITSRFYYIYGRYPCTSPSQIGTTNQLGDAGVIKSLNGPAWSISANVYCTSFSIPYQWQAGKRTQTVSVVSTYAVTAQYTAWQINLIYFHS